MPNIPESSILPKCLDARKFAQQRVELEGVIPLTELSRLADAVVDTHGQVNIHLDFGINEQGTRFVEGQLIADLRLICQRCLEPMDYPLEVSLNSAMVWSDDEANQLDKQWDPWIVGEEAVNIYDLIEDELMLSLPIVVYHDYDCAPKMNFGPQLTEKKASNPFQVLEGFKPKF